MAVKSKPLPQGPRWLRKAFDELRADVLANRVKAGIGTTVTESENGTAVNATATTTGNEGCAE